MASLVDAWPTYKWEKHDLSLSLSHLTFSILDDIKILVKVEDSHVVRLPPIFHFLILQSTHTFSVANCIRHGGWWKLGLWSGWVSVSKPKTSRMK